MFNRTLHTLSANVNGLDFGTRSFVLVTNGNVGQITLRLCLDQPYPHAKSQRSGSLRDAMAAQIMGSAIASPWLPGSPEVPGRPRVAVPGQPRGLAVVHRSHHGEPEHALAGEAPGASRGARSGRNDHERLAAPKWAAPRAPQAATAARFGAADVRHDCRPALTTRTLFAPDAFPAAGG